MHNMIFGGPVGVQTDQQLLMNIFNKQICDVSPRLQRLLLRAQKYEVHVTYIKGVDALSRVSPLLPRPTDVRTADVTPLHVLSKQYSRQSILSRFSQNRNKEGWYTAATSTLRTPRMALPEDKLRSKHIPLLAQQRRDNIRRLHSISWHPNDNPRDTQTEVPWPPTQRSPW